MGASTGYRRWPLAFMTAAAITFVSMTGCSDRNSAQTYGETGLPKNCRAIIAANIEGWRSGIYSPEEALESIDRNCGAEGHSWEE